jgi:PITH domain
LAQSSSSAASTSNSSVIPGQMDLQQFVSNQLECLNSDNSHPIQNIFKADASVLKSDVDEQLILAISFNQPVKVHSLKIIAGGKYPCLCVENGPKTIKTFVNRISTLSFEDTESEPFEDDISLTSDSLKPETAPTSLRYVKYQNVHHLTVNYFILIIDFRSR